MRHILIVDDKPENLYYLDALLTGYGYRVQTAQHGAEALVRARSDPPDLIVADLLMPVMDGYTLLRHWKSDARLRDVPFVVHTATYTEPEDEQLARSLGADDFILKPSEPDEFIQRLQALEAAHLEGRRVQRSVSLHDEPDLLKVYSETLVRKLEEKTIELVDTNQALQREVAERRRMMEAQSTMLAALKDSEERFRQLAETIGEVFWISDPSKTHMLYVSPAYSVIWGRSPEDLYAEPASWILSIHPDDRAQVLAALPGQTAGEYDVTYRVVRPDGSVRWVRDRAFPVHNDDDVPYRIVGLAEDITERRTIEAQLLRAQRLESIGTLAGGIAHDLNNVLTPILMSIELLRIDEVDDERAGVLDSIEQSAMKGAEMLRQILMFARGVEGKREALAVERLFADIERIIRDTFFKSITVRCTAAPGLPPVLGDETQLHQVLLNLCVNARDAMPGGGTIILDASERIVDASLLQAHAGLEPGRYVAIEVRDAGQGIPAELLERIFDPFFTTKDVGSGTGLGLSTSLAIVRSHGGFIDVRSTIGEGSTFVVYLPVTLHDVRARGPEAALHLPRGTGELILVVDDEPAIRDITGLTLEAFGYRVLLASDGAEGIAMFARHSESIAAVVTDLMMPGVDGTAAIRALRHLRASVPIVVVSGVERGNALRTTDGPLRSLPKPYRTHELLVVLHDLLHPDA